MKSFLIISAVIIILITGGIFYFYNQVTYIPEWYENSNPNEISTIIESSDKVFSEIKTNLKNGNHVEINNEELQAIILYKAKKELKINTEKIIKGINTRINENGIEIEAIVNVKNISDKQIPNQARSVYEKFINSIPEDVFENFYVKFEGKPINQNGNITLDNNSYIQLGKFKYSVKELSEQISGKNQLRNKLKINLFPFSTILLKEGLIIIATE